MNMEALRRLALTGARSRLEELRDEIEELAATFPKIDSLRAAYTALAAAITEATPDRFRVRDKSRRKTRERSAPEAANASTATNGVRFRPDGKLYTRGPYKKPTARAGRSSTSTKPTKPTKPRGKKTVPAKQLQAAQHNGKIKSWLTGRDVLSILAAEPEPVLLQAIADKLKVPYATIWWRLKVRVEKGHARMVDPITRAFEITPKGREALERDRDS